VAGTADRLSFHPDDAQGARIAVQHLQTLGRSRILHITGVQNYLAARIRADAYRELVGSSGQVMFGEWSEEWGHSAIDAVYSQSGPKPDAIFCGSDEIARGVIDALRDRGVSIPDDVAVVGFDNWEVISKQTRPPLTTIDMELKEIGHRAGLAILGLSRREKLEPGIVRLLCSIAARGSA